MDGTMKIDPATRIKSAKEEAAAFRAAHPTIELLDVLISDTCGVLRGKRLPIAALDKICAGGFTLAGSVFSMDITGDTIASAGLVWEAGDPDYPCHPIPGSLCPAPWSKIPLAQIMVEMTGPDGKPFFAAPRTVLLREIEKLNALGYFPVVASELEFFLVDRNWDSTGRIQPPPFPDREGRQRTTQLYNLAALDDFGGFLNEVRSSAAAQGIPVDGALSEYAPGQFEINLKHDGDILKVADQTVMFKRMVQGAAALHGVDATFMAKPYADQAGSGLHIHISLLDKAGANVFTDAKNPDNAEGSDLLKQAIAGLAATMGDAMAIFAPGANSYRRFKAESYAPLTPTWGVNNRTTALRLPPSGPKDRRIEHRLAGADANPYLVIAAILAGIRHGIEGKLAPPAMVKGNAYADENKKNVAKANLLPRNWGQALDRFFDSAFIRDSFGADFQRVYGKTKLAEYEKFHAVITPLELSWYLRTT